MHDKKNIIKRDQSVRQNIFCALQDIAESFAHWRIFCMIGMNDIRKRYTRSRLGQFWLTLSLAINIGALGFVWSHLFKMPVADYIPYLAVGTIFWTFISSCITEGAMVYISSTSYLMELNIPKISYINSLFVRNLIVLLHNLLVLIPIYFLCPITISLAHIGWSLIGLGATMFFLFPAIIVISLFSLRFRDCPNIIASLMQIVFYVTPIMWKVELMPERAHAYMLLNPFAVFLSLCRDPLMNTPVSGNYWIAALIYIVLAWIIAMPIFSRFRSRIVYWV